MKAYASWGYDGAALDAGQELMAYTDIRTDDSLFLAASGMIPDIVEVGEAELEKL